MSKTTSKSEGTSPAKRARVAKQARRTSTSAKPAAAGGPRAAESKPRSTRAGSTGGRSTFAAILYVLERADGPMHHADITARILRYKLAPGLKGKTPGDTIKSQLAVAARSGELVAKTAPGTYDLASRVTA